jgi:hypothetical protein
MALQLTKRSNTETNLKPKPEKLQRMQFLIMTHIYTRFGGRTWPLIQGSSMTQDYHMVGAAIAAVAPYFTWRKRRRNDS